jgi:hypothetical protein
MSTQKEISERWQREKLQCLQAKKKSIRDCRGKTPMSSKKIRKTQKPTPGASSSLHIQYLTSGSFCYKKQALTPKQIQEGKEKKNHTLHGSRKPTKTLKRREENHQQQKKKKTKTPTEMGADDDNDDDGGDGFM